MFNSSGSLIQNFKISSERMAEAEKKNRELKASLQSVTSMLQNENESLVSALSQNPSINATAQTNAQNIATQNVAVNPNAYAQQPDIQQAQEQPQDQPQAQKNAAENQQTQEQKQGTYTFIGDSIMNSAESRLKKNYPNANFDTKIGRQFSKLPEILKKMSEQNKIGDTVVIGLGTNGPIQDKDFDEAMKLIGSSRKVVFINTKMPDKWQDSVNAKLLEKAKQYPNVSVIDWHSQAVKIPQYYEPDKTHLKEKGQEFYTGFITQQVNQLTNNAQQQNSSEQPAEAKENENDAQKNSKAQDKKIKEGKKSAKPNAKKPDVLHNKNKNIHKSRKR